jgi:hypothetical protein
LRYDFAGMAQIEQKNELFKGFLFNLLGLLTVIPLAPLVNRFIPPVLIGDFNADLLLALIFSFVFVRFILWIFKPLIIPSFIMVVIVLMVQVFANSYNLKSMVSDYRNLVVQNWKNKDKKEKELYLVKSSLFDSEVELAVKGMKSKMNHKDSIVRNFAVKHSLENFDEHYPKYGFYVRFLSLFKYINANFKYVSDAQRDEYYATARETIQAGLGGDCDDHTILMISTLRSIGARCRMVLSVDHVYPELHCGDKESFLKMQNAITDLFYDQPFSGLYFREENGQYWINLDYTARHPGGPYVDNKAYAVVEF